jgi:hypothetical protein
VEGFLSTKHLYQATKHTYMLGIARKLIIPKLTKASHLSKINAYKINKHPIDPNFLTHVLWSKTNLEMQHIHLELPLILNY